MFIINIIDDIIVIIIITINHIMFQDLYHFGFCTKYIIMSPKIHPIQKCTQTRYSFIVNGLLLLKVMLMCQIYKMLYNYPMSIWKALHAHWRTTSSPKHAKHIIWRIIQVRMSFIPHMIFSVTQMIMLLLCLLFVNILFVWRGFHFEYLLLALWWICRYWFNWIQFTCALGWIR